MLHELKPIQYWTFEADIQYLSISKIQFWYGTLSNNCGKLTLFDISGLQFLLTYQPYTDADIYIYFFFFKFKKNNKIMLAMHGLYVVDPRSSSVDRPRSCQSWGHSEQMLAQPAGHGDLESISKGSSLAASAPNSPPWQWRPSAAGYKWAIYVCACVRASVYKPALCVIQASVKRYQWINHMPCVTPH